MNEFAAEIKEAIRDGVKEALDGISQMKATHLNQVMINDRREFLQEIKTLTDDLSRAHARIDKSASVVADILKRLPPNKSVE